jgi:hypothetical protein
MIAKYILIECQISPQHIAKWQPCNVSVTEPHTRSPLVFGQIGHFLSMNNAVKT